jgi:hypothetical protein
VPRLSTQPFESVILYGWSLERRSSDAPSTSAKVHDRPRRSLSMGSRTQIAHAFFSSHRASTLQTKVSASRSLPATSPPRPPDCRRSARAPPVICFVTELSIAARALMARRVGGEQLLLLEVRGGHFKTETRTRTEPEPKLTELLVYSGFRVRVRFLYVLYFGLWVRVRFLTFKTQIDRITRNIKNFLIYDDIII